MKNFTYNLACWFFLNITFISAQVPIIIEESAGISRTNEPVTLGVPFAKGAINPTTDVRIVDSQNIPVDAQFVTMATWDDGSIKWLKCDFQADVNANNTTQYALETNVSHTPNTELTATETGTEIIVTTGPLRFIVSKISFNLIDQAWFDLNGDRQYTEDEKIISTGASSGHIVSAGGTDYSASAQPPENIEIEEQGPMKVVIKISGRHYNNSNYLLKYETRIYAYAGQSFLKVWHVYANGKSVESLGDAANPDFGVSFDRYKLALKVNLNGSKTVRLGGDNGVEYSFDLPAGEAASLIQADRTDTNIPLKYDILQGLSTLSSGARAEGWCDVSDSKWGLLIGSRYFWQKYPKGFTVSDDGTVSFEPAPTSEFLWAGMGTGDMLLLHFHPATEASDVQQLAMGMAKQPLFARTTPQQYINSNVFYSLQLPSSSRYPAMDNYINTVTSNHLANFDNLQLYGNINFGDVTRGQWEVAPFVDESTWGNNYYDCILTAVRLFAQTGELRYVDIFVPMTWHFMETDCWNTYDTTDYLNGFCGPYGVYHRMASHFEQHYGEGIWYYYYLTGDERAREIGLRAAQSIVLQQWWANENVDCRMAYQRGSACLEAWKNIRDTAYLNHARHLLVDKILATQDNYGLIGGSFDENDPPITPEQTIMMALYSDALWKYIQELKPEDNARQQIINKFTKLADFFDTYSRKNPGEEEYWNFWSTPDNNQPPQPVQDENNPDATVYWNGKGLIAGTYAYAYDLSGNDKYKTLTENLLTNIWQGGAFGEEFWGKASCQAMKNMIHAAAIVGDQAIGVREIENKEVPKRFVLYQNYPNPFNPSTHIVYQLTEAMHVNITIFNIQGKDVKTLVDKFQPAGMKIVRWNGLNDQGHKMSSGVYFYKIRTATFQQTKKMILME